MRTPRPSSRHATSAAHALTCAREARRHRDRPTPKRPAVHRPDAPPPQYTPQQVRCGGSTHRHTYSPFDGSPPVLPLPPTTGGWSVCARAMQSATGGASTAATTKCSARRASHQQTPPLPLQGAHVLHKGGGCAPRSGRCPPRGWQQGREQPTRHGAVHVVWRSETSYGGAGGWNRRGCATWAPRSATRQGEEQHRHTERGSHTRRDKGGHSRQGGGAQQGGRGNWNSGNREPEWSGWQSVRMGGSDNKGDGLASQPRRYRVPGQPLLNRHQVGGVSRSPDGLFAQQEWEPIRGRPTVRGKRTYSGRPGQRVEEGTWAAQKHSEAGDGRPVDRGVWTAKTVKRPRQQPAHPQYANYWAPLTRKRHTMPHSAQSQHANYWAPRTRKRHQQEHRPQRPTASSDPTQHAKGRTGDRPGPRKGATTRRNVTQGGESDRQR